MKRIFLGLVIILALAAGCSSESQAAGLWVYSGTDVSGLTYEIKMDLESDGTGTLDFDVGDSEPDEITWNVEGDELCITYSDDSGGCGEFAIEGDRMTYYMFDSPMLFERWPDN